MQSNFYQAHEVKSQLNSVYVSKSIAEVTETPKTGDKLSGPTQSSRRINPIHYRRTQDFTMKGVRVVGAGTGELGNGSPP